jgi:hypothetical protein
MVLTIIRVLGVLLMGAIGNGNSGYDAKVWDQKITLALQ